MATLEMSPATARVADVVDLDLFARTPLQYDPFDFVVVPGFVPAAIAKEAADSFPGPDLPGVLPAPKQSPDNAFGRVLSAVRSRELTDAFSEKYGLKLSTDTMMVTLRARTRPIDGQIHVDSATKTITALIYLNESWDSDGGRLRVLRGPNDIEDMAGEVPPVAGTLISFRRSENSWHGHKPFDGVRKAIMFNWMVDAATARRELFRHSVSAGLKRVFGR
jgi:hypothetical protein